MKKQGKNFIFRHSSNLSLLVYFFKTLYRWIRYEEQAEDVLGRWSKPHVATLPQTSLDELRHLINDGTFMFDVLLSDIKEIAGKLSEVNVICAYFCSFKICFIQKQMQ